MLSGYINILKASVFIYFKIILNIISNRLSWLIDVLSQVISVEIRMDPGVMANAVANVYKTPNTEKGDNAVK